MPPTGSAESRRRRGFRFYLRETLIVIACLVSATCAVVFADIRAVGISEEPGGAIAPMTFPSLAAGWILSFLLLWRSRISWTVLGITCALPLVFWLDSLPALVAMVSVLSRSKQAWRIALATGITLVATVTALWRDSRGYVDGEVQSSLWNWSHEPWMLPTVLLVSALMVGVAFGIGMALRSRRALRVATSRRSRAEAHVRHLDTEVQRRVERERISREVHDALGHRLSLLSMQSGALEFTATDPEVVKHAAALRENAQQAMADLRALLAMLHESDDQDIAQTPHTIDDIPTLVDEALASGSSVVASVSISGTDGLNPVISHSAYRITQELLTNARKHAAQVTIRLNVTANPQIGVEIAAANRLPEGAHPDAEVRAGHGLVGMTERAKQCGGQCRYWVDEEEVFRVAVRLPWDLTEGAA